MWEHRTDSTEQSAATTGFAEAACRTVGNPDPCCLPVSLNCSSSVCPALTERQKQKWVKLFCLLKDRLNWVPTRMLWKLLFWRSEKKRGVRKRRCLPVTGWLIPLLSLCKLFTSEDHDLPTCFYLLGCKSSTFNSRQATVKFPLFYPAKTPKVVLLIGRVLGEWL